MNKQKTRPPKTLKCSKSKTIRHRKLKSSHLVDLIRSTWCELFSFLGLIVLDLEHFKVLGGLVFFVQPLYFNYEPLLQKIIYALFLWQNLNLRTFLSSGMFCTQKSALRKFFNLSASGQFYVHFERKFTFRLQLNKYKHLRARFLVLLQFFSVYLNLLKLISVISLLYLAILKVLLQH